MNKVAEQSVSVNQMQLLTQMNKVAERATAKQISNLISDALQEIHLHDEQNEQLTTRVGF